MTDASEELKMALFHILYFIIIIITGIIYIIHSLCYSIFALFSYIIKLCGNIFFAIDTACNLESILSFVKYFAVIICNAIMHLYYFVYCLARALKYYFVSLFKIEN